MKNLENLKGLMLILAFVFIAAFTRLLPHWPNFTAIGAIALFGAAVFNKKSVAFFVPLFAMWFSDLFINNIIYHSESFAWFQSYQIFTLAPMAIIVLMGLFLFNKGVNTPKVIGGAVLATAIFFLVSNFGTWLSPYSLFPNTMGGLISTYIAGLPFIINSLAGDLFFSLALFGSYYAFTTKFPTFKLATSRLK